MILTFSGKQLMMKETDFIRQNQNKWAKDEIIFDKKEADPDQVS
jgi:hypothetical protein